MFQQLILFLLATYASSSHYRGGSVSWDIRESDYINGSSTVPVRVYQRHSWRRSAAPSFWGTPLCDTSTIASGTSLIGENSLICGSYDCYTSVSYLYQSISTQVLCTDFSVDYDYASGEKYTTLQLPINKRLTYTYESCCWIGLLPVNDTPSWELNLVIDTHRRVNGKFNNAPMSAMNPIVKVEVGQTHVIDIPMADIDGDQLRCRWGVNASETGGIYQAKGQLQSNPCQLTYNAIAIGYEGVAVVIEDFDSNNQVLSSIPLQFLIEIVPLQPTTTTTTTFPGQVTVTSEPGSEPAPPCPNIPEYEGDWGPGACIGVTSNHTTEIRIVVKIPCENSSTSIQDILTISPTGMTKGPITQDPQYNNQYIMNLQWTPQTNQYGIHQLCVTPVDNSSRSGRTVCFSILVDVRSPNFIPNSMSPTGVVPLSQSTWTIATDVDIIPPIDPSISAVFYKRDSSGAGSDIEVIRGQHYYILLDAGVATINQSCGIQSSPITDTQFWTFSIAAAPTTVEVTTITPEATTTTTAEETTATTTSEEITTMKTSEETATTITLEEITATITFEETTTMTTPEEITTATPTMAMPEETTTITTTTTTPDETTTTTAASTTVTTSTPRITEKTTIYPTTQTSTTTPSTSMCSEWLLFGTVKNITTNDNQRNYSFCFYVNTTLADVTILANTWTPCATWKTSGAADPLIDLYNITNNPILLAQNDDGNSISQFNCYAAVISYRLYRGNYQVIIRNPKCNYGRFEVRLSVETTNRFK